MKRLFKYLDGYRKYLFLGPFFKLLEAIFELIVPLVTAKIIDIGIAGGDTAYIKRMSGVIILLGFAGLTFALICQYFAAKCAFGFGTALRKALYSHINSLSRTETDKLGPATLTNRLINDTNAVQTGVNMAIRLGTRVPFLIIGAVVMAMSRDVKLSLIFLVTAPLISFIIWKIMSITIPMYRQNQKKLDRISLLTGENLEGIRVIRAFSKQDAENKSFREATEDLSRNVIMAGRIAAVLNPLTFMIINLAAAVIIWCGGFRVDSGDLTQGDITAFVSYMTSISLALIVLANLIGIFTKAFAATGRISEIFDMTSSMADGTESIIENDEPALEFDHVNFRYSGASEDSVTDISFALKKGESLGIIGGTGSGKSTIASLIPRFYDVTGGEIRIFGKNIKEYRLSEVRRFAVSVPQKAAVISGTVADNIRMGRPDATDDEIIAALKTAQAWEFVSKLPEGINSPVQQFGRNFSGGQKQRLTIARAVISKPAVLILDDSTSALDMQTDYLLRKAISEDLKDTSVIMISQRATSLKNADRIIVMEDGKCEGSGTNDELESSSPVYREIIDIQKAGE
ncbi:ABC transporter ATP-binding protein [Ruminococcus sp. HUN007]|uniref:ABC transporter ATP-binding protein n=1 Tax=Ruminococcus sp. HUN007 TaxID=1514668 RepID=UPI0005D1613F|nr:ABC transporter ATP-binding protein [Ruminococcus sp. HUN007]